MVAGTDRGGPKFGVFAMLLALVIAAFLGGALGLVWQSASLFDDEGEEEVVTVETPTPE